MKKSIWIPVVLVTLLVSLMAVGYAFAQTETPSTPEAGPGFWGNGRGMMGAGNGMMGGRWSGVAGYGPLHEYIVVAMAEALGMTPENLQAAIDSGKTMWDVAEEQGLSQEQFTELMVTARTDALNQAVEDGVITQEQADWMISRMAQMQANGFGPGSCPMHGGQGGFHPMGNAQGRWNR